MFVAVFTDPITGIACVLRPVPSGQAEGETPLAFVTRIANKDVPAGITYRIVDDSILPASRRWRNAWRHDGNGTVAPALAVAKLIHKAELLADRDARLIRVRAKRAAAEEDGQAVLVAALKTRAATLRGLDATIDAQLAAVTDLAVLDVWKPTELQATD